jgi:uncharacterized membrane protein YgaE (UPF0421/DUF939 family)
MKKRIMKFNKMNQIVNKSDTKGYLFYAIGEITLVVLGILIALQINNWNESTKRAYKEQEILLQLKEDFKSNLQQLNQKNDIRSIMIRDAFKILNSYDNPAQANKDSLIKYFSNITINPTFDPIKNDINNSENIRLISNSELKKLISYWSSDIVAVQEEEINWTKFIYEELLPLWVDLGIQRDIFNYKWQTNSKNWTYLLDKGADTKLKSIGKSRLGVSLKEILNSREIESSAAITIGLNKTTNIQGKALKNRIVKILHLIDNELNNN